MATKKVGKASRKRLPSTTTPPDIVHVPFHAKDLTHPVHGPAVLKDVPTPMEPVKEPDDFKVECKVTSVSVRFWSGVVFVALESTDGQDLLNLLRNGQNVVVHYQKPSVG